MNAGSLEGDANVVGHLALDGSHLAVLQIRGVERPLLILQVRAASLTYEKRGKIARSATRYTPPMGF